MTTVNCVQSPISSSKSSSSSSNTVHPEVQVPFFSTFCIKRDLVFSGSSSVSNSPTPMSSNLHLAQQTSPKLPLEQNNHIFARQQQTNLQDSYVNCPFNVSMLATVFSAYKTDTDSAYLSNCTDVDTDTDFFSIEQEEEMLENIQNQETPVATGCSSDDDDRTLKLAVELTMLNMKKMQPPLNSAPSTAATKPHHDRHDHNNMRSSLNQAHSSQNNPYRMATKVFLHSNSRAGIHAQTCLDFNNLSKSNSLTDVSQNLVSSVINDDRSKKSQNMTECVPVPSSEHVAEIVGRQGCKIKALRAKTNTYIKTPVRNEEPVFVVTGRKEDVSKAKHEILSAAEHFTVIRASRRINDNSSINSPLAGGKHQMTGIHKTQGVSSSNTPPGQITVQVRVPYRLVGLVVGTKGNTIKHIQHETQTYIVTPSRDKEPVFEVTGLVDNVELAKKHIEIHIATRLGSTKNNSVATSVSPSPCTTVRQSVDMDSTEDSSLHSLNALSHMLNDDLHSEILSSIYRNGICSTIDCGHIRVHGINTDKKCSKVNVMNGFFSDELEGPSSYAINDHVSNTLKCVDFVNNLIDTSNTSFCAEQRRQFT